MRKVIYYLLFCFIITFFNYKSAFSYDNKISISAYELSSVYTENELLGEEKFKGKTIIVSGEVDKIARDLSTDQIYVSLVGDEDEINCVDCFFDEINPQIKNLKKGQRIRIEGKCVGIEFDDVILQHCKLL